MILKYTIAVLLFFTGSIHCMDRRQNSIHIDELETTRGATREENRQLDLQRKPLPQDWSDFIKEKAEFLFDMGYFPPSINDPEFRPVITLSEHFELSALWHLDRTQAELLILDIFHWVYESKQQIPNDESQVIQLFKQWQEDSKLLTAVKLNAQIWIPGEIVSRLNLDADRQKIMQKWSQNRTSHDVFFFYKKLFHLLCNMHRQIPCMNYAQSGVLGFLCDDNPDDTWEEMRACDKLPAIKKTATDSMSYVIESFIKRHLRIDSEAHHDAFQLAIALNIRSVKHAFMRVIAEALRVIAEDEFFETPRSNQEMTLKQLAESIPFHEYPGLLKHYKNVAFVVSLLNEIVKEKLNNGTIRELIEGPGQIFDASSPERTIPAHVVFADCINTIANNIEHLNVDTLELDAWLQDRIIKSLKERYPVLFTLDLTRATLRTIPWILLGRFFYETSLYRRAYYCFMNAEKIEPTHDSACLRLGILYVEGHGVPADAQLALRYLFEARNSEIETIKFHTELIFGLIYMKHFKCDFSQQLLAMNDEWSRQAAAAACFRRVASQDYNKAAQAAAFFNMALMVLRLPRTNIALTEEQAHVYLDYACNQNDDKKVKIQALEFKEQLRRGNEEYTVVDGSRFMSTPQFG